jgi:hypothetical protein
VWEEAERDLRAGTFKTIVPRMPIILAPESPISTPEQLQKLAELSSLPDVIDSDQLEGYGRGKTVVRSVKFCPVSFAEFERMEAKAELVDGMVNAVYVMFDGAPRFAWIVKALREGVTLGDQGYSMTQDSGSAKESTP